MSEGKKQNTPSEEKAFEILRSIEAWLRARPRMGLFGLENIDLINRSLAEERRAALNEAYDAIESYQERNDWPRPALAMDTYDQGLTRARTMIRELRDRQ